MEWISIVLIYKYGIWYNHPDNVEPNVTVFLLPDGIPPLAGKTKK